MSHHPEDVKRDIEYLRHRRELNEIFRTRLLFRRDNDIRRAERALEHGSLAAANHYIRYLSEATMNSCA